MNIAIIRRMVQEGDLSYDALTYLIACKAECEWLDYKKELNFDIEKTACDITKDVIAMKNVGGGYILAGVEDKTWNVIGIPTSINFDTKMLRDKIQKFSGVYVEVDMVTHNVTTEGKDCRLLLMLVRQGKRNRKKMPVIVTKDYKTSESYGMRRGDIYARKGDSTIKISSSTELEDLIDTIEEMNDQDTLEMLNKRSAFAIEDGLYRLLDKGYFQYVGRETLREELEKAILGDPRIWIINVHGPGGVGKSALVNWVVYKLYNDKKFESIVHLTAKDTMLTPDGIISFGRSLYSLDNLLDHILNVFGESVQLSLEEKKDLVLEIFSAWRTLLVLDNMETVQDGRILHFIQNLPVESKAKVLITSRHKTGGWEFAFPVKELDTSETRDFVLTKSKELQIDFPLDEDVMRRVKEASGGLPLAIQWIIGRYKADRDLSKVVKMVIDKDSPVLEFSFRNIWGILSAEAKATLCVLSIFEEYPTIEQVSIASKFTIEKLEQAFSELGDTTLVTRITNKSDGRVVYSALPITLSFARNQFPEMGDFETECRQRYNSYIEITKFQEHELASSSFKFDKYGFQTVNEKKAAILCHRGQSEFFTGNIEQSDLLFKQARDLAPRSAYVYAMSASYELSRNRIGAALSFVDNSIKMVNKKTGALCYLIKARIHDIQNDKLGRIDALTKALEYDKDDYVLRHQLGVALSKAKRTEDAIEQFTMIIDSEKDKPIPSQQLLMAYKTRMINLQRLKQTDKLNDDIKDVRRIFRDFPHLSNQISSFSEYFND